MAPSHGLPAGLGFHQHHETPPHSPQSRRDESFSRLGTSDCFRVDDSTPAAAAAAATVSCEPPCGQRLICMSLCMITARQHGRRRAEPALRNTGTFCLPAFPSQEETGTRNSQIASGPNHQYRTEVTSSSALFGKQDEQKRGRGGGGLVKTNIFRRTDGNAVTQQLATFHRRCSNDKRQHGGAAAHSSRKCPIFIAPTRFRNSDHRPARKHLITIATN